jgi:cell division protein FtsA
MKDLKVVFDIGNGYIKGIIFDIQDGQTTVLAKHMVKTRWMRKGKIMDVEDFSVCINEVLEAFAKKLWGDVVEEVFVWISHPETVIKRVSEQKRVLDGKITHEDVAHLSDVITESSVHANYEVLKLVPIQWILDEQTKVKDPIDMEARKLELVADVFMIPKTFFNNLMDAFQKLDVYVAEIVPNILWACEIALDFDVKDLWVLLVDIGANQTTYVVYEDGIPLFYGMIPLWGEDVTKDVSIGLQVDIKDAERIKREKAIIIMDSVHVEDDTVDMAFLSEIVLARYEEIFELIQTDLVRYQKDWRLPGGVVMLGGGAQIENVTFLAKDVFKLATYKAKDTVLKLPELSHSSEWLNTLGIYVWVNKYHQPRSRWFKFSMDFKFFHGIAEFFRKIF